MCNSDSDYGWMCDKTNTENITLLWRSVILGKSIFDLDWQVFLTILYCFKLLIQIKCNLLRNACALAHLKRRSFIILWVIFLELAKDDESANVELFFKKIMGHFEILCKLISIKYTEWVVLVFSFRARIMHFKFERLYKYLDMI